MLRLFEEIGKSAKEYGDEVGARVGNFLKMVLAVIILWPLAMIACAMMPHHISLTAIPIVALALIVALVILAIVFIDSRTFALLALVACTSIGRKAFSAFAGIIGAEILVGACFSAAPTSSHRGLILLVLIALAMILFAGIPKMFKVVMVLVAALAIVFLFGGMATESPLKNLLDGTQLHQPSHQESLTRNAASAPTTPPTHPYCRDGWQQDISGQQNHLNDNINDFVAPKTNVCLSGWYDLPSVWRAWDTQTVNPGDDGCLMWLQFFGQDKPIGPLDPNNLPDFHVVSPTKFRIETQCDVRFFRNG